jgi:hypothetical protein
VEEEESTHTHAYAADVTDRLAKSQSTRIWGLLPAGSDASGTILGGVVAGGSAMNRTGGAEAASHRFVLTGIRRLG